MKWYRRIVGTIMGLVFVLGGLSHFYLGQRMPESYAVFADTALVPCLREVWLSFAMPNIGWLTVLLGIYEILAGLGLFFRKTSRWAALAMFVFLVFITVVGYGFPTTTVSEDFLKNRLITLVMALLVLPFLAPRRN